MKKPDKILLGFEEGSGETVYMGIHHSIVTGMTEKSGKTTTLEAIIHRSKRRAIAFKTKRGEAGFTDYHEIPPYFKERADWQYVASILEATMRERMKFERSWIIKASRGAKDLKGVYNNVIDLKEKARKDSLSESVYTVLEEYLKIVVPQIEETPFSTTLKLRDGINVMDLVNLSLEMRSLVIRSVMEHVITKMRNVIIVIPEAWEYIPQRRSTPVKWYAETFIRKGASVQNWMFLDSQDLAGIDKTPIRQCDNWIMGRQREAHEVERLRDVIGKKFASEEEVRRLKLGHFYASIGDDLKKVYVLPAGVPEDMGKKVALGEFLPDIVKDYLMGKKTGVDEKMYQRKYEETKEDLELERVRADEAVKMLGELQKEKGDIVGLRLDLERERKNVEDLNAELKDQKEKDEEKDRETKKLRKQITDQNVIITRLKERTKDATRLKEALAPFFEMPKTQKRVGPGDTGVGAGVDLKVIHPISKINIVHEIQKLDTSTSDLLGRVAWLYAERKLGTDWFGQGVIYSLFSEHGWPKNPKTKTALVNMTNWGYLEIRMRGSRPEYRVKITPDEAREKGLITVTEKVV